MRRALVESVPFESKPRSNGPDATPFQSRVTFLRSVVSRAIGLAVLALLFACSATPPPRWAEGGAPLALPQNAMWEQPDGERVFLRSDGRVWVDGEEWVRLDVVGRVVDSEHDPVALLQPDGHLVGTDQQYLGRIGVHNASAPWAKIAWLRVAGDGTVLAFDRDGQPVNLGRWQGCKGAAVRACTLVSHLVLLEAVRRYSPPPHPMDMGVGIGFWY